MEKENLANHVLRTAELCSTILEGMLYLGMHGENIVLRQETALALETVRKSFEELSMEKRLIEASALLEKAVRSGRYQSEINWEKGVIFWYASVLKFMSEKIMLILETCPVCGSRGTVLYIAFIYGADSKVTPLRTEMECTECGKKWFI